MAGSIRYTLSPPVEPTQTVPAAKVRPPGPSGTGMVAVTRFVAGFTRETVLSELFVTQTDSAAKRTSYEP